MNDEIEMRSTRVGFGEGLAQAGGENDKIVALCADLKDSTKMSAFADKFPDRFVEVGIAEQNLVTVASGMAAMGKKPFVSSYAAFCPGRCWEQIRTTICLNDQPVVIVGSHAGLSVGPDGATHQVLEDIALMRSLPNMTVICPADANEAKAATLALADYDQPAYLRLARANSPVFTRADHKFDITKAHILAPGTDVSLIATGLMTYRALEAREELAGQGIRAEVVHVPVIKPLDEGTVLDSVRRTGKVVTCEEAQINGGLGAAIAELLSEKLPTLMMRVGVNDRFGESGEPDELAQALGVDSAAIVKKAASLVNGGSAHSQRPNAVAATPVSQNQPGSTQSTTPAQVSAPSSPAAAASSSTLPHSELYAQQLTRMGSDDGFIAALDQSGGSTPKALASYGIGDDRWTNDAEMYALVHQMRTRIITSPAFSPDKIIGAILFKVTMDSEIDSMPTADYLWQRKNVVPFLKVDSGLADLTGGVQMLKPMPELDSLLDRAVDKNIFGTKMRSVIKDIDPQGIRKLVKQQFDLARQISAKGLMPIIEPEVDIHSPDKRIIEDILLEELHAALSGVDFGQVMLKLTLPEVSNHYEQLMGMDSVLRIVALSGGYSISEADQRLSQNDGIVASFSRALVEGLSDSQSQTEFDAKLSSNISLIFQASVSKSIQQG